MLTFGIFQFQARSSTWFVLELSARWLRPSGGWSGRWRHRQLFQLGIPAYEKAWRLMILNPNNNIPGILYLDGNKVPHQVQWWIPEFRHELPMEVWQIMNYLWLVVDGETTLAVVVDDGDLRIILIGRAESWCHLKLIKENWCSCDDQIFCCSIETCTALNWSHRNLDIPLCWFHTKNSFVCF